MNHLMDLDYHAQVNTKKQPIFFVSDSTAITVETLGRGILSQFPTIATELRVFRFVEDAPAMERVVAAITAAQAEGGRAVVFCSLVDASLQHRLEQTGAVVLDVFTPFSQALAQHWGLAPTPIRGLSHGSAPTSHYERRMQAIQYALTCDDGVHPIHYDKADLILLGVSRSGKTPTALYLAMHYSLFVANYPFSPEELAAASLPTALRPYRARLFGLTLSPQRLMEIREARRPHSHYASLNQCEQEVSRAERLYRQEGIPSLDVTRRSVEEVAGQILRMTGHSGSPTA